MIYLPKGIPVSQSLGAEEFELTEWQSVAGVKRILLLNLMPEKAKTDDDIATVLYKTGQDVQLLPIKIKGQTYKTTPMEYTDSFYLPFEAVRPYGFDGLIITGAPVEKIGFEEVRYWKELCEIMSWSKDNGIKTLYICWGAQAGLYYHYGVQKYLLPQKMFGIFPQTVRSADSPLMKGLSPCFPMPNSRHTEVRKQDILSLSHGAVRILAESPESGIGLAVADGGKTTFIVGHLEYNSHTLHNEYKRDIGKGLPIQSPAHYYNADGTIDYSWESAAVRFYDNWLDIGAS